jgi:hypothetical protein
VFVSWGSIDIAQELREIKNEQTLLRQLAVTQGNLIGVLVALASIEQSVLDDLGTTLGTVADGVQAIIDDPSNDLGPADLSSVNAGLARLQALVAAPETPVDENPDLPPADGGDTPADAGEPTA